MAPRTFSIPFAKNSFDTMLQADAKTPKDTTFVTLLVPKSLASFVIGAKTYLISFLGLASATRVEFAIIVPPALTLVINLSKDC